MANHQNKLNKLILGGGCSPLRSKGCGVPVSGNVIWVNNLILNVEFSQLLLHIYIHMDMKGSLP